MTEAISHWYWLSESKVTKCAGKKKKKSDSKRGPFQAHSCEMGASTTSERATEYHSTATIY